MQIIKKNKTPKRVFCKLIHQKLILNIVGLFLQSFILEYMNLYIYNNSYLTRFDKDVSILTLFYFIFLVVFNKFMIKSILDELWSYMLNMF